MKLFKKLKDGGPDSTVTGYFLIECKPLFSIVLLKFEGFSGRDVYHSHAFNCVSWLLKGFLLESFIEGPSRPHIPSIIPFFTRRQDTHIVDSIGTSWLLSFRGPWSKTWKEVSNGAEQRLAHGRIPFEN